MHASIPKQIAHNRRVLSAEEEIAGINCDVAEFLSQMSANPDELIVVCVNSESGLKRHEECIGGQLSIQGNRQMTATNKIFEGMSNDVDSATLAETTEEVEWTHVLQEAQEKRSTRRIVIYPTTPSEFATKLHTTAFRTPAQSTLPHPSSTPPIPRALEESITQKFVFGCTRPRKFQQEVVPRFLKMVPMFSIPKVTPKMKSTEKN
jgi:hypothetical protein